MIEIERKFLIHNLDFLKTIECEKATISQGYLFEDQGKSLRVRVKNTEAFLTLKFGDEAIVREEFEVSISLLYGKCLLEKCAKVLEKDRYTVHIEDLSWEIDVFKGTLFGLCLAEVELKDPTQVIEIPPWVGEEVTQNPDYLNINLIKRL